MNVGAIIGLAVFGTLVCGLCARSFIAFVTVREPRTNDSGMVAVAWICALAIGAIALVVCCAIGYLGAKP